MRFSCFRAGVISLLMVSGIPLTGPWASAAPGLPVTESRDANGRHRGRPLQLAQNTQQTQSPQQAQSSRRAQNPSAGNAAGTVPAAPPDGLSGDAMIDTYLAMQAHLEDTFPESLPESADAWSERRPELVAELAYMLGLDPMPERTPLHVTITGTFEGKGFVVDRLHFQSRPGLYVTANLYRPAETKPGERLPAVLYLCGHANSGRAGHKLNYQSCPIWFARHGYICLIIDTLQRGEIAGIHHGTYREGRAWWVSRGYTPAGVECWNGIRAIDYLTARPDVDPARIAVTGISGGGASTIYLAAMDTRVTVAVPISGMSDLKFYVAGHGVDGHCDCMFMHNTFRWPWVRIAALIAPRPMLFINSDNDRIFPMDGNERISNRMERFYALFGAGDRFETLVSIGGHAYRDDIRQATYRFINTWLKGNSRPVTDSEVDLVTVENDRKQYPIAAEDLTVFPRDEDLPKDQLNTTIDELFVPMARVEPPTAEAWAQWRKGLFERLRLFSFSNLPADLDAWDGGNAPPAFKFEPARPAGTFASGLMKMEPERGIFFGMKQLPSTAAAPERILIVLTGPEGAANTPDWVDRIASPADTIYLCETRGHGETRWSRKTPPNRVERAHVLVGTTVDAGRVLDAISAARYARVKAGNQLPVYLAGHGAAGIIAAYAAFWDREAIGGAVLLDPPLTHMSKAAPVFLNVLRICDIPDVLGALAPRPLTLIGAKGEGIEKVRAIYEAAGAAGQLRIE